VVCDKDADAVQRRRCESRDASKAEGINVIFPPKKRRRKSVTVDDGRVAPADTDKVNYNHAPAASSRFLVGP